MAAPTSPDGPSPVEVLTQGQVPRLSLSEASGTTLLDAIASANAQDAVVLEADQLTLDEAAAQRAKSGGGARRKSSLTQFAGSLLAPFLPSSGEQPEAKQASGRSHPLDKRPFLQGSDCTLPTISLHIPVYDAPLNDAEDGKGLACCVPDELQDGLAELARFAVRRDISFASEHLLGIPDASSSRRQTGADVVVPAGLVRVGGHSVEPGIGARWYWNVIFEKVDAVPPPQESSSTATQTRFGYTLEVSDATFALDDGHFRITVRYTRPCDAFRALGYLQGIVRNSLSPVPIDSAADADVQMQDDAGSQRRSDALHPGLYSVAPARSSAASSSPPSPSASPTSASDGFPPRQRWYLDAPRIVASQLSGRTERCSFETLGTMIDCSRNGVLQVSSVKFLCRKLALMGYNMLQLYTEDTYEITDEPFFGYLRGRYTQEELKEIDDYAFTFGIEVIACIQTLGHLGQMLQWPRFLGLRDTTEVLLAELPETYTMLEKMIAAATRPLRSKKIHLGMDETHGLGHGRYHSIFGQHKYKDPTRIFVEHLQKVNALCERMGLQPMIWSDMLFCLNARNNSLLGYYDSDQAPDVQGIPANMDLVYWDYYHTSESSYANRIQSHRDLSGRSPWMAAGSWTWSRFWTALPFTFATCRASQIACKQASSGVKHVFLTIWGDEGNEVDLWSSLPAWLYYADHAYTTTAEVDVPMLRAKFDGIVGASFDDFVVASRLDDTQPEKQSIDDRIHFAPNTSKWLMWEEPFFGFVSPTTAVSGIDFGRNYRELATYLQARLAEVPTMLILQNNEPQIATSIWDYPFNARLRFAYLLAKVLSHKAGLRASLHKAYIAQDWQELDRLAGPDPSSQLSQLRTTLEQLHRYHRQMWMSMYKPFGWETVELRYGGQRARIDTMCMRIRRFLEHVAAGGEVGVPLGTDEEVRDDEQVLLDANLAETEDYSDTVTSLPELAVTLQVVYGSADQLLDYHRVSRPTYV